MLSVVHLESQWSHVFGAPSGAWLSPCGMYRTLLWRTFAIGGDAAPLAFVMLNPSTADESKNDPTIRRCLGFAHREGAGGIIVANLSPYRTPYPRDLDDARDAGIDVLRWHDNYAALRTARSHGPMVLAWGAGIRDWLRPMADDARAIAGHGALCLGKTKRGEPRHPLMLRNDTTLARFDACGGMSA